MCEKEISSPTIKLFGKTIPLASATNHDPPRGESPSAAAAQVDDDDDDGDEDLSVKLSSCSETTTSFAKPENKETISENKTAVDKEDENPSDQGVTEDLKPRTASSGISEIPKTIPADEETDETSSTQDKTLKKPDKIVPCPRCDSMNTKFCYYNNCNVNQPRHFCKNCQRYWTAGGIMRNVPVGAGRRKNKNATSAAHYRDISMSASLQTAHSSAALASNGTHNPNLGRNGTVLTFGSDSPLCESMAYVRDQQRILVPSVAKDIADDQSCGSSNVTTSYSSERVCQSGKQEPTVYNCQVFPPHQVPCFPGAPWPYPWNSPQWTSAMPPPGFFHTGFPISVYPAPPYWGCTTPCSWNVPCNSPPSSTLGHCGTPSGPNSVTLGKHPRDEYIHNQHSRQNNSGCVLIPKTLRIGDPREAAKSSIWETLGIKNEKGSSINKGGIFKSFQPMGNEGRLVVEQSLVLQANPAAFSRSLNFNERS